MSLDFSLPAFVFCSDEANNTGHAIDIVDLARANTYDVLIVLLVLLHLSRRRPLESPAQRSIQSVGGKSGRYRQSNDEMKSKGENVRARTYVAHVTSVAAHNPIMPIILQP